MRREYGPGIAIEGIHTILSFFAASKSKDKAILAIDF